MKWHYQQCLPDKFCQWKSEKGSKNKHWIKSGLLVWKQLIPQTKHCLYFLMSKAQNPRWISTIKMSSCILIDIVKNSCCIVFSLKNGWESWAKCCKPKKERLQKISFAGIFPVYLHIKKLYFFLLSNIKSVSQSMDEVVIRCLKGHYRKYLVKPLLHNFDCNTPLLMIKLLTALQCLVSEWIEFSKAILAVSRKLKFLSNII